MRPRVVHIKSTHKPACHHLDLDLDLAAFGKGRICTCVALCGSLRCCSLTPHLPVLAMTNPGPCVLFSVAAGNSPLHTDANHIPRVGACWRSRGTEWGVGISKTITCSRLWSVADATIVKTCLCGMSLLAHLLGSVIATTVASAHSAITKQVGACLLRRDVFRHLFGNLDPTGPLQHGLLSLCVLRELLVYVLHTTHHPGNHCRSMPALPPWYGSLMM